MRILAAVMLVVLAAPQTLEGQSAPATGKTIVRVIPHATTGSGRLTSVDADEGDQVVFRITETDPKCFTYNLSEQRNLSAGETRPAVMTGSIDLQPVTHSDGVKEYVIEVRPTATCDADDSARKWTIPVRLGWKVGAGAGYTFGTSTARHFFLKRGTKDGKEGFFIAEDKVDDADQQIAAFVQLLNEKWPNWNMLAVGTSTAAERPQTFVGTGIRFANYGGILVGATFGKRNRLPVGMRVGDFLEQEATLGSLTENTWGAFVAVQLSVFPGAKNEKPTETVAPKGKE